MNWAGIKRKSAWEFKTSSTGALGLGIAAAEGGHIYLTDPSKRTVSFLFGAAGVGIGFKLPKIPQVHFRGHQASAAVAPASFPNWGVIYTLDTFTGQELKRSDITGTCMFIEVGAGLVGAFSTTAMLLGMNPYWVPATLAVGSLDSFATSMLIRSATAVILVAGLSTGLVAGCGGGGFIGGLV